VVNFVTIRTLITRAYGESGRGCSSFTNEQQSGGPEWIGVEQFDLQALIPEGTPAYTVRQFENNDAPALQVMLQTLLTDRLKLVLTRASREMPVEVLTLGRTRTDAQLAEAAAETIRRSPNAAQFTAMFARIAQGVEPARDGTVSTEGEGLWGINATLAEVTSYLSRVTGRPVVDRTGLAGPITFHLNYERVPDGLRGIQAYTRPLAPASMASLRRALREQLGLELESGLAPVEVLTIERVERPSEN
jgi:uncharacterized protein (TIGR03435 family)